MKDENEVIKKENDSIKKFNKGETLVEMIISIAIFALLINLVATIMVTSNNIEYSNFETRNFMNEELSIINGYDMSYDVPDMLTVDSEYKVVTCNVNGTAAGSLKYRTIRTKDTMFIKLFYYGVKHL